MLYIYKDTRSNYDINYKDVFKSYISGLKAL